MTTTTTTRTTQQKKTTSPPKKKKIKNQKIKTTTTTKKKNRITKAKSVRNSPSRQQHHSTRKGRRCFSCWSRDCPTTYGHKCSEQTLQSMEGRPRVILTRTGQECKKEEVAKRNFHGQAMKPQSPFPALQLSLGEKGEELGVKELC